MTLTLGLISRSRKHENRIRQQYLSGVLPKMRLRGSSICSYFGDNNAVAERLRGALSSIEEYVSLACGTLHYITIILFGRFIHGSYVKGPVCRYVNRYEERNRMEAIRGEVRYHHPFRMADA